MQKELVANLYNPHEQTKEELIEGFVVRHKLFNKLFQEIKRSDMRYPEQHFLIEGQRGMGKTTMLLRLCYEIENDRNLNTWLIPLVLKEEAYYGITRLFKLWETMAQMLADREAVFADLPEQMENAYDEDTPLNPSSENTPLNPLCRGDFDSPLERGRGVFPLERGKGCVDSPLLRGAGGVSERGKEGVSNYEKTCFSLLFNALEKQNRKIILFIDNVGEMFKNFSDMEAHRFREVLMTCAHLRIVGATAVTLEASFKYEHAFYEFFKKETLTGLDKKDTHDLLLQLAKYYHAENEIENIIKNQSGRVDTLRILTGGVIRTVILLFEIFMDNKNGNAISDLDKVLDRVTPLYKHRMDDLAPLQREVVHTIAIQWDAISVEDIARKTRVQKNEVLNLIAELEKVFIIQRAVTDTQTHLYYLSERFFNIWCLMRLAEKGSKNKVIWLVRFLESWYDKEELVQRAQKHISALRQGHYSPKAAFYLTEALAGTAKLDREIEHELISTTKKYLEEKNKSLLAELSPSDKELYERGMKYYWDNKYEKASKLLLQIKSQNEDIYFCLGYSFDELEQFEKAEKYYLMAVEKEYVKAMFNLGWLYHYELKDYAKAEKYYLMAVEKEYVDAMVGLGNLYKNQLKDYAKAEKYYLMAVEKEYVDAMNNLGNLYRDQLKDYVKAEKYYLMAVKKQDAMATGNLGILYGDKLKDYAKFEKYILMALKFAKDNTNTMFVLGYFYHFKFKDYVKAKKYYLMAMEEGNIDAINNLGVLYRDELKDYDKAKEYYLMAMKKGNVYAMYNLGWLYTNELKDYAKAEKYYLMAVEKEYVDAMVGLGNLYKNQLKDYAKAEKYYLMAVEKENVNAMFNLGILYADKLKDYTKAEKYYLMAVEKGDVDAMNSLAWDYFKQKREKTDALKYAKQAVEKEKKLYFIHTLTCVHLWHNQIEKAIKIDKEFMYDDNFYEEFKKNGVILYLMLLVAKKQYQHTMTYFEDSKLNLKSKFKPLYYALLHFMDDKNYSKCPPELNEPVNDIIQKIKQMAIDYA